MKILHTAVFSLILAVASAAFSGQAQAGYTGASATLTFESRDALGPVVFANPATVGAGLEFSAGATDVFNQDWILSLDILDTGIVIGMRGTGAGNISASDGLERFIFDLSFADVLVSELVLDSYTNALGWESGLTSVSVSGPNSLRFAFNGLYDTAIYTFDNVAEVPEPASVALLGLGLAGLAALRRARRDEAITPA